MRPTAGAFIAAALLLGACGRSDGPTVVAPRSSTASTSATPTASPTASPTTTGRVVEPRVTGTIARGLTSPWGLVFLADGSALVAERDTGRIRRIPAGGGEPVQVGRIDGVVPGGEGGLLGIALPTGTATAGDTSPTRLYVYYTAADDNRVVSVPLSGSRVDGSVAAQRVLIRGIPKGSIHNGGRLRFGPDGFLYVSTGETGQRELAQDRSSLGGKILRVTTSGDPAPGNPVAASPIWSLGHRNVQGLAFDSAGRLWASEFGQDTADELNLIVKGGNYGWPVHEGAADDPPYVDPAVTWPTDQASPSGIAVIGDVVYLTALRGGRLWRIPVAGGRASTPKAYLDGEYGRLRIAEPAPDGSLWVVTSNTDGRGDVRDGDDRIVRVDVG